MSTRPQVFVHNWLSRILVTRSVSEGFSCNSLADVSGYHRLGFTMKLVAGCLRDADWSRIIEFRRTISATLAGNKLKFNFPDIVPHSF